MDNHIKSAIPDFLNILGLTEEPFEMFNQMIDRYKDSFLKTKTWENVHKKINKSKKAWKEI